jgi:hypothetical protein
MFIFLNVRRVLTRVALSVRCAPATAAKLIASQFRYNEKPEFDVHNNKERKLFRSALIILLILSHQTGLAATRTPEEVVAGFFKWTDWLEGEYGSKQKRDYKKHFTAEMACLLQANERLDVALYKLNPSDKPKFAESDTYSGANTLISPSGYIVKPGKIVGHAATVRVNYFSDTDEGFYRWSNVFRLRRHEGRWVISDIKYDAEIKPYEYKTLRDLLYTELRMTGDPKIDFSGDASACRKFRRG